MNLPKIKSFSRFLILALSIYDIASAGSIRELDQKTELDMIPAETELTLDITAEEHIQNYPVFDLELYERKQEISEAREYVIVVAKGGIHKEYNPVLGASDSGFFKNNLELNIENSIRQNMGFLFDFYRIAIATQHGKTLPAIFTLVIKGPSINEIDTWNATHTLSATGYHALAYDQNRQLIGRALILFSSGVTTGARFHYPTVKDLYKSFGPLLR